MAETALHEFIRRLHDDRSFRSRFAAHPADVLRDFGFDPELLDLPSRIDPDELETRIADGHRGNARWTIPGAADSARLTADELWERFHFIRTKFEPSASVVATVTGVIYGTTATTQITIGAQGTGGPGHQSMAQIRALRDLGRIPLQQLSFSISGPDGVAVSSIRADVLAAFLKQLGKGGTKS